MEKINIKFHENGTVTFQHKKILQFVPELSVDKNSRLIVPNIPLLVRPLSLPQCARKNTILNFLNNAHLSFHFIFISEKFLESYFKRKKILEESTAIVLSHFVII
jgi:hypothetical protein